jgi:hypothetical protein
VSNVFNVSNVVIPTGAYMSMTQCTHPVKITLPGTHFSDENGTKEQNTASIYVYEESQDIYHEYAVITNVNMYRDNEFCGGQHAILDRNRVAKCIRAIVRTCPAFDTYNFIVIYTKEASRQDFRLAIRKSLYLNNSDICYGILMAKGLVSRLK